MSNGSPSSPPPAKSSKSTAPGGSEPPRSYPGEQARQGEIILRRPWQRGIFIAGLIGCVVLALVISVWLVH